MSRRFGSQLRCSGLGLALLLPCLTLPSRALACVVGTGTGASCTEAALNACLPGGGSFDGTVTFNCGGAATITVTSTKSISADTTIDGGGVITISGGNSVGVFYVNTGVKFTVQNLTITNGNSAVYGGGISNGRINGDGSITAGGTVTITNSTFSRNSAADSSNGAGGAIANLGTLTVTNSTFSGNSAVGSSNGGGGAIANLGTLTVTNSTFSGNNTADAGGAIGSGGGTVTVTNSTFSSNSAVYGGGIHITSGTLTVVNSTFSGNSAIGSGGDGDGGGIANGNGGAVTVINSTFSGNSVDPDAEGGGGIANGGTLTVVNSTFSGNSAPAGGGIGNGGTLMITNTIIANSTSGGNCAAVGGGVTDGGHNIDDDGSCGFSGTSLSNTNPLLDPSGLANNGGPTQTIALQAHSPAINAGDESVCAAPPVSNLDQRGYVRPGAGATNCSIGAYEADATAGETCIGDCDNNGKVTVDEILTMVNIALGNTLVTTCEAGDANHDGQITVDEILTAVNNALNGCTPMGTPTPTPTAGPFVGVFSGTIAVTAGGDKGLTGQATIVIGANGVAGGGVQSSDVFLGAVIGGANLTTGAVTLTQLSEQLNSSVTVSVQLNASGTGSGTFTTSNNKSHDSGTITITDRASITSNYVGVYFGDMGLNFTAGPDAPNKWPIELFVANDGTAVGNTFDPSGDGFQFNGTVDFASGAFTLAVNGGSFGLTGITGNLTGATLANGTFSLSNGDMGTVSFPKVAP